jgi:hypothetical protein
MKPLWLILLAGGGAWYFSKLKETGKQLSISILNISSFRIVDGSLQLAVNVALDNPTNNTITIKKPYIKTYYKNNEVGNSLPSADKITINANARTIMKDINIQVPFMNLPSVLMSLLNNTTNSTTEKKEKIPFDILVSTEVSGIIVTTKKTFLI